MLWFIIIYLETDWPYLFEFSQFCWYCQIAEMRARLNVDVEITEGTPAAPAPVETFEDMVCPSFVFSSSFYLSLIDNLIVFLDNFHCTVPSCKHHEGHFLPPVYKTYTNPSTSYACGIKWDGFAWLCRDRKWEDCCVFNTNDSGIYSDVMLGEILVIKVFEGIKLILTTSYGFHICAALLGAAFCAPWRWAFGIGPCSYKRASTANWKRGVKFDIFCLIWIFLTVIEYEIMNNRNEILLFFRSGSNWVWDFEIKTILDSLTILICVLDLVSNTFYLLWYTRWPTFGCQFSLCTYSLLYTHMR